MHSTFTVKCILRKANLKRRPVTEKDCLDNIVKFCNKELRKTGWFIFNDHNVSLEKIRLLNDYEKDANFPLPAELSFESSRIDYHGIKHNTTQYKWSEISCLVIKNDTVPADYSEGH